MKLEIGKWYMNKVGQVKKITWKGEEEKIYMFCSDDECYTEDGRFCVDGCCSKDLDLTKEVRVTIEDVEPASEFEKINRLLFEAHIMRDKNLHIEKAMEEIERLQKLFEGDNQ